MKQRTILIIFLLTSIHMMSHAALLIGGREAAYDARTGTYLATVPESRFGSDWETRIRATGDTIVLRINDVARPELYKFENINADSEWTITLSIAGIETTAKLQFTYLPIIDIKGNVSLYYSYGSIGFTRPDAVKTEYYLTKVKYRGGTTNAPEKNKRNFHLKFLDNDSTKLELNLVAGLRSDNSWLLDAGQIDMLRIRNIAAAELWNSFAAKPYYFSKENKALTGIRGTSVEVFFNGAYHGIYQLTEAMDRKQMRLKKYDEDAQQMHGMLWKFKGVANQSRWYKSLGQNVAQYDSVDMTGGVEVKYPEFDDLGRTDWTALSNAIAIPAYQNDVSFATIAPEYFDMPVIVDYFIFMNLLCAKDNVVKNQYWGVYDVETEKKLTLAVWDLDATMGNDWTLANGHYHSLDVAWSSDLVKVPNFQDNILFSRLLNLNVDNFRERARARYEELRQGPFETERLVAHYKRYVDRLILSGAAKRDEQRWTGDTDIAGLPLDISAEWEYTEDWIRKRVKYLDNNFLFIRGDINQDEEVNVSDVTMLVDYLLGTLDEADENLFDVNGDGEVNASDVTRLINIILGND